MDEPRRISRIRNIDWRRAMTELDNAPPGVAVYVGIMDQSVRTHINKGRYHYINPDVYRAYTKAIPGGNRAHIYLYRACDESQRTVMGQTPSPLPDEQRDSVDVGLGG
jgi:hypothetical protein